MAWLKPSVFPISAMPGAGTVKLTDLRTYLAP